MREHSISLREFIDGLAASPHQGTLDSEDVTTMLDARGPLNSHLVFPREATGAPMPYYRDKPLSLDERVYGDYLLLTYNGHDPTLYLTEHSSLDELKWQILGPAGSLNSWNNAQFAFYKLRPLPFTIRYTNASGQRKRFSIEEPEPVPDDWDMSQGCQLYRDIEFEWVNVSDR
jgi:hypothetical protein